MTFKFETMADVRRFVAERHEPRFILPARFRDASFASFEVATGFPQHRQLRDELRDFVNQANTPPRRFWRRSAAPGAGEGRFLVGPPGVGKTHLLAAAYRAGTEPKLFATFDELVAAAGLLGMPCLSALLGAAHLVCIDEIVLEDPANIMMLATLLGILIETNTRIVATANMPPAEAGGRDGWVRSFERELGQIAAAFDIERIDGRDRRLDPLDTGSANDLGSGDVLTASWRDRGVFDRHPPNARRRMVGPDRGLSN